MKKIKADVLRQAMKLKGFNQTELSLILGKGDTYISDCFRRESMQDDDLKKLCTLLRVDLQDVLNDAPKPVKKDNTDNADDNVIELLLGIYKVLRENQAAIRTTNIKLDETIKRLNDISHYDKTIAESVVKIEKNSQFFIRGNGKGY